MNSTEFADLTADEQRRILAPILKTGNSQYSAGQQRLLMKPARQKLFEDFTLFGYSSEDVASNADTLIAARIRGDKEAEWLDTHKDDAAPVPAPAPVADTDTSAKDQLAVLQSILGGKAALDVDAVQSMIDAALTAHNKPKVVTVTVNNAATGDTADMGIQHKTFPDLLVACSARLYGGELLNIWLNGEAGTGKTTAAKKVAEALQLSYHFVGAIDNEYKLAGFIDAQGRVVSTEFRKAWTDGGVFLFDEIDGSSPNAVLSFNGALANGTCPFPDGLVPRHKDCVIIAAGNTVAGATANFNGRFKPDGAFFDRFALLQWDIDEALETATCSDSEWCSYVQAVRGRVIERKYKNFFVTPRASYYGAALLAAGMSRDTVIQMTLKKTLTADQWLEVA